MRDIYEYLAKPLPDNPVPMFAILLKERFGLGRHLLRLPAEILLQILGYLLPTADSRISMPGFKIPAVMLVCRPLRHLCICLLKNIALHFPSPLGPWLPNHARAPQTARMIRHIYGGSVKHLILDVPLTLQIIPSAMGTISLHSVPEPAWIHRGLQLGFFAHTFTQAPADPWTIFRTDASDFKLMMKSRNRPVRRDNIVFPITHSHIFSWPVYVGVDHFKTLSLSIKGLDDSKPLIPPSQDHRTSVPLLALCALLASIIAFRPKAKVIRITGLGRHLPEFREQWLHIPTDLPFPEGEESQHKLYTMLLRYPFPSTKEHRLGEVRNPLTVANVLGVREERKWERSVWKARWGWWDWVLEP